MRFRTSSKNTFAASVWLIEVAILFLLGFQAHAGEIVFILGADVPGEPAYYGPAIEYYRNRNAASPPVLVTTARSLAEVREILQRTDNDRPWQRVTLVSHGTPWRGMLTNIYPDGVSATLENIESATSSGGFSPLPETKINSATIIHLESCGIGRRTDYLTAVARLFSSNKDELPLVEASEDFIAFVVRNKPDGSKVTRRFELPVVIRTVPGDAKSIGTAFLEAQLDELRVRLDKKMKGASDDAIWAVSPINITVNVMLSGPRKITALRAAEQNEFIANVARVHGIGIRDIKWELASDVDSGGMQELKGSGVFILMRANLNNVNNIDLENGGLSQ